MATVIEKTCEAKSGIITHHCMYGEMGCRQVFIPRQTAKGNLRDLVQSNTEEPYQGGPGVVYIQPPFIQRFRKAGVNGFIIRQFSGYDI